jgi:NADH-quinone oxidoreductase subunit L
MMLVVTGVGFLIHLYATEYMKDDAAFHRFFAYLNLFIFSMLVLIMGHSLPVLFVGWEGVGLCSYLLIGFWYDKEANAAAGKKAFIANRVGDFGLLVAMAMLVYFCGSLTFDGVRDNANSLLREVTIWPLGNLPTEAVWDKSFADKSMWPAWLVHVFLPEEPVKVYAATLVGLAVFLGCAGKSAQIPLYVWLPDAMAGPTPVSALIHAATMVTAGVYLVARMADVFVLSPAAMATVACVGAATAILAASIGFFQRDLKKILAYSTVSQLGFMFIGVGVGAFAAGFFHVFTHAFFKACLFLGAGSVIHAMHTRIHDTDKSQDIEKMGGLRQFMPVTHATFLVSCLSIAGLPFVTAGFYSKDEILWKAWALAPKGPGLKEMWTWPDWLGKGLYWVGIVGATMTAFYMFRAYFRTFWGEFRGWKIVKGWKDHGHGHGHGHEHEDDEHLEGPEPKESAWPMTLPLVILGAMAIFAGFLGAEPLHVAPLIHKLDPIWSRAGAVVVARQGVELHGKEMWLMMVPGALAFAAGTGAAYALYVQRGGQPERDFAASFPRLYQLMVDKWRVDELYDATVIGMVDALADIFTMADKYLVDGVLARVTAALAQGTGAALRIVHTGRVQVYAAAMVIGMALVGWFFVVPHAHVTVDDAELKTTGRVVFKAVPGLGYSFKWTGAGATDEKFSRDRQKHETIVAHGETHEVKLTVVNAFGREDETSVSVTRPGPQPLPPGMQRPPGAPPGQAPALPGLQGAPR